jgi:hypothetical protein
LRTPYTLCTMAVAHSLYVSFSIAPVRVTFPSKVSTLMEAPLIILSLKSFDFTFVVTK